MQINVNKFIHYSYVICARLSLHIFTQYCIKYVRAYLYIHDSSTAANSFK